MLRAKHKIQLPNQPASEPEFTAEITNVGEVAVGYWIILGFLLVLFGWIATIPLSSAAIAPGVVGVKGAVKQIQHLEGGIVKDIKVHDGDLVSKGQSLLLLNDELPISEHESLKSQLILTLSREARHKAEYSNQAHITFDPWLLEHRQEKGVSEAMSSQEKIFHSRQELIEEKKEIYRHRISQTKEQIQGEIKRLDSLKNQHSLVNKELRTYRALLKQGMVTRSKLFSFEDQKSRLNADISGVRSSVASAKKRIKQLKSEVSELSRSYKHEAAENLDTLKDTAVELRQRVKSAKSRRQRTVITAPIDGYVVNLNAHTKGGVIASGQIIMEIVPSDKPLIIEARINPKDRDSVKAGQQAEIRFSAFDSRNSAAVKGKVSVISADHVIDPVSNQPFFKATVEITEDPTEVIGGGEIHPGMQADVLIITGKQTTLSYLLSPLEKSFNRALREE